MGGSRRRRPRCARRKGAARGCRLGSASLDFYAYGGLLWLKEGLDEVSFTANGEGIKPLEPAIKWYRRVGFNPSEQRHQVSLGDIALGYTLQEVREQRSW